MQDEFDTMCAHGARAATRLRGGAIIAATALLAVLVIATWAMAGAPGRRAETAAARQSAATGLEVTISEFAFHPRTVEVSAGAAVTWTNADGDTHAVTSANSAFTSPTLDSGETLSHRPWYLQLFLCPAPADDRPGHREVTETPPGHAMTLRVVPGGRTLKLTAALARASRMLSGSALDDPTKEEATP